MRLICTFLTVATLAAGCTPATQTTSGADYLAGYQPVAARPEPAVTHRLARSGKDLALVETRRTRPTTDDLIRDAAAIEPLLRLPARIGLARIEDGRLTTIPEGEAAAWQELAGRHAGFGSFAAVDPFLADYTARLILPQDRRAQRRDAMDLLTRIRLGAARQHMDAVLIYEIGARERRVPGFESLRSVGVLGAAPLPAEPLEKEGVARALLMDVRNGYPYGIASASVDLAPLESPFWSGAVEEHDTYRAKAAIARALTAEADQVIAELTKQIAPRTAQAD